jgi:cytochrome c oxidase cbb3-type subunit III
MNDSLHAQAQRDDEPSTDLLLDHEYDGIKEFDNPMPRWWRWIFWASFYFSIGYIVHYHLTGNGTSVQGEYEADVALAREADAAALLGNAVTEETLSKLAADAPMMADAAKLFSTRCSSCHGGNAEGLIGPNLTDGYWLNGDATLLAIHTIVGEGVLAKGMPSWNRQLRPIEVAKLAAYVGTLRNTNRPGPKGAEGRLLSSH